MASQVSVHKGDLRSPVKTKCDTVVPQSHDTGEKKWRKRNGLDSGPSSPEIFIHHCGLAVDTAAPGHRGLHSGLNEEAKCPLETTA
ncbi:hypothetical protein SRHO_G00254710 [Serrasalmus rhombeus]